MADSEEEQYQLPPTTIWNHVSKIAISEDKPIMLDYWVDSIEKNVFIGLKPDDEKLLVKSSEEYTSPISRIYKVDSVFIICTENSIYLTSSEIDKRRVS
tara:strand:- start:725 stop:1021 length:297 start_codon:yes stop_codon:yes gene_type:complete